MTDVELRRLITYNIGKECTEGCIDTPSSEYISKVLNVPLDDVECVMREIGI